MDLLDKLSDLDKPLNEGLYTSNECVFASPSILCSVSSLRLLKNFYSVK